MNWAPYAVYNPQLWHWPETWPLVSLSPTVEPFIVIGYATFYMAPFFPASGSCAGSRPGDRSTRFVWRHPLISLALLILVIGFVFDAAPRDLPRPHPAVHLLPGDPVRLVLRRASGTSSRCIWESSLVTLVMIPAGVLLLPRRHRPDPGREAGPAVPRLFRTRPALGTFAVMFVIVNLAYFFLLRRRLRRHDGHEGGDVGGLPVAVPRGEGLRPAGLLRAGRPARARTSPGSGPGWESGQPDGRPRSAARRRRPVRTRRWLTAAASSSPAPPAAWVRPPPRTSTAPAGPCWPPCVTPTADLASACEPPRVSPTDDPSPPPDPARPR